MTDAMLGLALKAIRDNMVATSAVIRLLAEQNKRLAERLSELENHAAAHQKDAA